jgi:hypothetical protein
VSLAVLVGYLDLVKQVRTSNNNRIKQDSKDSLGKQVNSLLAKLGKLVANKVSLVRINRKLLVNLVMGDKINNSPDNLEDKDNKLHQLSKDPKDKHLIIANLRENVQGQRHHSAMKKR